MASNRLLLKAALCCSLSLPASAAPRRVGDRPPERIGHVSAEHGPGELDASPIPVSLEPLNPPSDLVFDPPGGLDRVELAIAQAAGLGAAQQDHSAQEGLLAFRDAATPAQFTQRLGQILDGAEARGLLGEFLEADHLV